MKPSTCPSVLLAFIIFICMNECAVGLNFEVTYQGGFLGGDLATQRREAFEAALAIYEGQLGGTVPVKVRAEFRSFNEPQGSLRLAESDSANASANLSSLPLRGVWFPAAVASQLTGVSLPASSGNPKNIGYHMYCEFNSDVDGLDGPGGKWAFHYQSTPLPMQRFDFVRTALHEIGHGLGFQVVPQYWLQSPYDFPAGMPCIYSWWLRSRDDYYLGYFVELSRVERDGAMTSRNMWWCGPNIVALGMYGLANHNGINLYNEVEIYAPNNLEKGNSLDHWGQSLPVSQTEMEPPYNLLMRQSATVADLLVTQSRDIDITRQALLDICWTFKDVSVTPSRLRFQRSSSKAMGDAQTIVLANNGPNLTITALTLVGPHLTDFSFSAPTLPYSIPTLGSMTIPISFEPSDPGFKKASLHIEWSCNGTYSSDVPLTGCATAVDSDEDGISDYDETRDLDPIMPGVQNPFDDALADSTGGTGHIGSDWVPDGLNDWDGDGMLNGEEFMFGYNPMDPTSYGHCTASDTDGDGISDADETSMQWLYPTPFNPYFADATGDYPNSDSPDGIPDGLNDYDGDGQSNACECAYGSDPTDPNSMCTPVDTDGDGLSDMDEMLRDTDPHNPDSDGDGLSDNEEVLIGTDPLLWDTDGDGLSDDFEVRTFSSGTAPFNPVVPDSTGSGCEVPLSRRNLPNGAADGADDYDCDGMSNAEEQQWGYDPTDASSFASLPLAGPPTLALLAGVLLLFAVHRPARR